MNDASAQVFLDAIGFFVTVAFYGLLLAMGIEAILGGDDDGSG